MNIFSRIVCKIGSGHGLFGIGVRHGLNNGSHPRNLFHNHGFVRDNTLLIHQYIYARTKSTIMTLVCRTKEQKVFRERYTISQNNEVQEDFAGFLWFQ